MARLKILGDPIVKAGAIALGNFDGLHLGHQAVFHAAGKDFSIISFNPSPNRFFHPEREAFELYNAKTTTRIAYELGARAMHYIRFDQELAELSPRAFLDALENSFQPERIAVGADFAFGKNRAGRVDTLKEWGLEREVEVVIVPLAESEGEKISSTLIRQELLNGNPHQAASLLGRPYSMEGIVREGDQRGRDLGFPTANLYPRETMLPKFGIYATKVEVVTGAFQGHYSGASSLGVRPSFGINQPNFETHILDFEGDLYGEEIRVELMHYLRPEIKFDGLEALIDQIRTDVDNCRKLLAGSNLAESGHA